MRVQLPIHALTVLPLVGIFDDRRGAVLLSNRRAASGRFGRNALALRGAGAGFLRPVLAFPHRASSKPDRYHGLEIGRGPREAPFRPDYDSRVPSSS